MPEKQADLDGDAKEICRVETRQKGRVRFTTEVHTLETTVNKVLGWREDYMDDTSDVPEKIKDHAKVRDKFKSRGFEREKAQDSLDELVDSVLHVPREELPTTDDEWQTVGVR